MAETRRIVEMKKGQKGIVAELITDNENIIKKLVSIGVLPGITLEIVQTFPTYVLKAGYTQIAVDKEIASAILVSTDK